VQMPYVYLLFGTLHIATLDFLALNRRRIPKDRVVFMFGLCQVTAGDLLDFLWLRLCRPCTVLKNGHGIADGRWPIVCSFPS
jgi:hypothetical protein